MANDLDFDQWSSIKQLAQPGDSPTWVPEGDRMRIAAYQKYEEIFWNDARAFQLMRRGTELQPIVVPNAMTICNTTAHYLLKDPLITFKGEAEKQFEAFIKREKFRSRFSIAKHSGVVRGDYIMHLTADEDEEEGRRLSLVSVDPASYFPDYDDDDLDKRTAVTLATQFVDSDNKIRLKRLIYKLIKVGGKRRVSAEEGVYELDQKWRGPTPTLNRMLMEEKLLPEEIQSIPVYHFKNIDWQGQPFGSSELRGFERILSAVNQTLSDEELALALEGLGVYATDAGAPQDDQGNEEPWEIAPAKVMEVPTGAFFKRVEGVKSVEPMLDHVKYLEDKMMEGSSTFLAGSVDVQVASSGIALAIRFLPQLAKVEERDLEGTDLLANLFFDWTAWMDAYEGTNIGGTDPEVKLGDKLPLNREERVSELNNMLDRNIISRKFYRAEMKLLGYNIPDNIDEEIKTELEFLAKFKMSGQLPEPQATDEDGNPLPSGNPKNPNEPTIPKKNGSNNRNRVNESKGTESGQTLGRQARATR